MHVLSLFRENAADLAAVSSEPDYDDTSGVKEENTDSKAYLLAQRNFRRQYPTGVLDLALWLSREAGSLTRTFLPVAT